MPAGRLRLNRPSVPAVTVAAGVPVKLLELNAYTLPDAARPVPGAGPPLSFNVPVTVPSLDPVEVDLPRGFDDEQLASTSSTTSTAETAIAG